MEGLVQSLAAAGLRPRELGGGRVEAGETLRFGLPTAPAGYADAQIDDYGAGEGFRWRPGSRLSLRARFSHPAGELRGTAGFGFWNAPYGDASRRRPALPRAAWFFYGSAPNDLPFAPYAPDLPGRGWFAATLDATRTPWLLPLAPAVLFANQFEATRRRIWPAVSSRLGIHAAAVPMALTEWHSYRLEWRATAVRFWVDDRLILESPCAPRGPLGFVCWLDNQYLVLTSRGRFRAGLVDLPASQWMEVAGLALGRA